MVVDEGTVWTMLADQIIAYVDSHRVNTLYLPSLLKAWRIVGERVKNSQRFVLDRGAVHLSLQIAESSPKRLLQALSICRLPFKKNIH